MSRFKRFLSNALPITVMVLIFVAFITVLYLIARGVMSIECNAKYADYEHKYGILSGCMVKVEGKWTPAENFRTVSE